ncbi:hypothetical protein BASA81_015748 [Batrachochytrium salamandrivorans]|nr:hypothetical protein BASA81_015748 [Batrachochytrium salamandrivorans]
MVKLHEVLIVIVVIRVLFFEWGLFSAPVCPTLSAPESGESALVLSLRHRLSQYALRDGDHTAPKEDAVVSVTEEAGIGEKVVIETDETDVQQVVSVLEREDEGVLIVEEDEGALIVEEDEGALIVEEDEVDPVIETEEQPVVEDIKVEQSMVEDTKEGIEDIEAIVEDTKVEQPMIETRGQLTPQDLGGYHSTTLTHVFFLLSSNSSALQTMTLVFVIATPDNTGIGTISPSLLELQTKSPPQVLQCFSSVSISLFPINRNQTRKTRRLMVEGLLRGQSVRGTRGYGLFLEPHSRPVKPFWLDTISTEVLFPAPAFWLKGGFQRFYTARTEKISWSFNSITVYRLSGTMLGNEEDALLEDYSLELWLPNDLRRRPLGTDSFAEFCMFKLLHSMIKFGIHASTEQVSIWYYLLEFKTNYNVIRYQLAHRLIMTETLQDADLMDWELTDFEASEVVMVQGGRAPQLPKAAPSITTLSALVPHNDALTHVFVVFPSFQVDKMHETLWTSWLEHPPCVQGDWDAISKWKTGGDCTKAAHTDERPELVFVVSRRREVNETREDVRRINNELKLHAHRQLALPDNCKACFRKSITVCILPLFEREDNHVLGSKRIFEHFLHGACVRDKKKISMALYLEPDTQPIKHRWLSSLSVSSLYPSPRSMIKGSMFLGPKTKRPWRLHSVDSVAKLYLHINGNALYQLRPGKYSFPDYYFNYIKPAIKIKYKHPTAMDLDIFDVLLNPPADQIEQRNVVMSNVHYTDLLGNFYGYHALPVDVRTTKPFMLAHVSAGVDFMAKDKDVKK